MKTSHEKKFAMAEAEERSLSTHTRSWFTSVGRKKSRPMFLAVVSPPSGGSPMLMPALAVRLPSIRAGLAFSVKGVVVLLLMESPVKGKSWILTVPPAPEGEGEVEVEVFISS
jgi:hypothetical protein